MSSKQRLSKLERETRRIELVKLRSRKRPWAEIAADLGYSSADHAAKDFQRACEYRTRELRESIDSLRTAEMEHLEELRRHAMGVLERTHPALFQGDVIRIDGEALIDDGPTLNAIATLLKVSESYRRLLGMDAPAKVEAEATVRYTINGIDTSGSEGL